MVGLARLPLVPSFLRPCFGTLLHGLREERANLAQFGVPFASWCRARVSTFADDITVFVSPCLDIEAVKKAVARNEMVAGAKVNFSKKEGLRLGVWFESDLQLERNWWEELSKVEA